ncbi:type I restriction enzyme specificity HsdS domain protein [Mycoplasma haemofelis Ohio2]|uniref:Type I restriction enzyme specificity HsdS domain protein n=1 Tax=Mycoplasma haemofelis (strain Ohio2) TaxID=859194 RepID=F6FIJ4_MYCHI|nr:type I restriction enzyme specificity HsdS domain protein [Mycoplasma haemofelis Ohio2]
MTAVGACCGKVGINLTDQEFFFSNNVLKFSPNEKLLTKRYLYHFLLSQQEEIEGMRKGSSQPFVGQSALKRLKIPVPSLETQMKISETLDKFREIEREIEREISLRDKQYEYYRNYLITGSHGE